MKKLALVSVLGAMAMTVGCEKKAEVVSPLCDIAVKSLTGAAQGVAGALGCANLPAVAASLTKPVTDLAMCSEAGVQGLVGDLVCPQVASFVLGLGTNALPADWQCSGGPLGDTAKQTLLDACKKAVTF